jgi:hypothetical protein
MRQNYSAPECEAIEFEYSGPLCESGQTEGYVFGSSYGDDDFN